MELTVPRSSLSLAVLVAILCSVDAMNYLAFPRMGRSGYLAFPRMGRSQVKSETGSGLGSSSCCGLGLKSELLLGQDGKEELRAICPINAECCDGLREVIDEKPDGVYYSMCLPDIALPPPDARARSPAVVNKLKSFLDQ